MKKMIRYSLVATALLSLFSSCKKPFEAETSVPAVTKPLSQKSVLKQEFAKIVVKALSAEASFRTLLKEEALKQFDNDFDVLYEEIKNKTLANGETVKQLLNRHTENKELLTKIEQELPLLTLFVPELPENSFSAENWNTETQIPQVGTSITETNDVPMISTEGTEYILKSNYIPNFPVVVIKECERVKINKGEKNENVFTLNSKKFEFLHKSFDRSKNIDKSLSREVKILDQKIVDAYNLYSTVDGWQRDYIYYNITPTTPNGEFSYDFKETITEVNMVGGPYTSFGDGLVPFNKISDQTGEPQYQTTTSNPNSGWTGGNYEFKVIVLFNAKNGLGTIMETYFPALPSELFILTYEQVPIFGYYQIKTINTTAKPLDLKLFNWDLNQYASTIKIDIEEVDVSETITESETVTTKFATNFAIESLKLKKIGLKFGASLEQTNTNTFTKTYTLGNDKLGSVIINFADKVIKDRVRNPLTGWMWKTQNYATGFINLSIEPKRVQ